MTATRNKSRLFSGEKTNKESTSVCKIKVEMLFSRSVDPISTNGGDLS